MMKLTGTALESRLNVRYSVKGVEFSPVLPVQITTCADVTLSLLIPALSLFFVRPTLLSEPSWHRMRGQS